MKKQFLETGKIVGTHGIKGEVRIEPWCDSPEFLCAFKKLYLDPNGAAAIEVKSRPHKNITLAKIKGVETIDEAERLRGKTVYINRDDINLGEGVHFVQDLLGLEIRDADSGRVYGTLTDVLRTGANDVYEITADEGEGPVNAIDKALRKALEVFYPELKMMHLIDFKVRVVTSNDSTAAITRVLIDSTDGARSWTTMGASRDIINASVIALTDSLEYMLKDK